MNDKRCKHCNGKFFKLDGKHWVMKSGKPVCKKQALKKLKTQRKWVKGNVEKIKNIRLNARYGINLKQYNELYVSQEGKCKLCLESLTKAHLDHCHATGIVRGILCNKCNLGLGLFRDNSEALTRAADYVSTRKSASYQKMVT